MVDFLMRNLDWGAMRMNAVKVREEMEAGDYYGALAVRNNMARDAMLK
jgi:hypothetical protein